jgi:hypothetical protein
MLKSGYSVIVFVVWTAGTTVAGQLRYFAFKSCHVFGAIPLDCRIQQAFSNIQDLPSEMAMSMLLVHWRMEEVLADCPAFSQFPE